ncbi:curved DNA-binding protein CbpA [Geomicrobium halophilum]|uniref:Curved DNA-binding protein CbpA n=1 Tax=Geomicrobium halophilum TaxID=549000 RepID=A0A841PLK2_9BACL|nr:molecular chaperone DnaJ [Geomicrobium halophilum]MBB6449737.1 curved DNA-binding protein CbpA [Geomicrobium halophilum]
MKFFHSVTSEEELKKEYRRLCKKHHPDQGGQEVNFIQLKEEYEQIAKKFNKDHNETDQYMKIVDALIKYHSIDIEIIGTWIWVTGETYPIKEDLKGLDFKFAKRKKAWYWHQGDYKKHHRKNYSLDEIRNMHERKTIKKKNYYVEAK